MHGSLNIDHLLSCEIAQLDESGFDVSAARAAVAAGRPAAEVPYPTIEESSRLPTWSYVEPESLDDIKAASDWPATPPAPLALDESYAAAVERAWQGRVAGNMLGKPVEGWERKRIRDVLDAAGAWPLIDYFPAAHAGFEPGYNVGCEHTIKGLIDGSVRDDDVDYTVLNLHLLAECGPGFTTEDVAGTWLSMLPFLQTYTAERAAIRNLVAGVPIESVADVRNPYREFIGAAIRADAFGYVNPGDPAAAAEAAYVDAVLSHRANGVYGEMWCAALVAAAFTANSAADAIQASLGVVPTRSRLAETIELVSGWHAEGLSWDETLNLIDRQFEGVSWVHTNPNAAVLVAALLHGDGDFTRSIGLTVAGGLDTDSNGATAGSVAGILAREIAPSWVEPLNDRVSSAVFGYDGQSISGFAEKTVRVARGFRDGTWGRADQPYPPRDIW